jgi:hypothetical protein
MPAPKKRHENHEYAAAASAAVEFHIPRHTFRDTTKDCAVKALALALGVHYNEMWDAFAAAGRKTGKPTPHELTRKVAKTYGYKLVDMLYQIEAATRKADPKFKFKRLTTYHARRFPEIWASLPVMLLQVRKHIACHKPGDVADWSASKPRRLRAAFKLVKV